MQAKFTFLTCLSGVNDCAHIPLKQSAYHQSKPSALEVAQNFYNEALFSLTHGFAKPVP